MELIECIEKLEKSKIKAGDGEKEGKYPLYTCSPKVNKFLDNYLYDTEAIILSTGGNPVINYHKGEFSYSTDCLAIKSNGKFENKYLYYYLISKISDIAKMFRGAGIKHLNKRELFKMNISFIDKKEQKIIVKNLDRINNVIELKKKQLKELDIIIKSQFVEMFGDISKSKYEQVKLSSIAEVKSSHRVFTKEFVEKGIPFYRGTEIGMLSNGEKINKSYYISVEHYQKICDENTKPKKGDLLLPSICDKGQVWMVDTENPFYYKDGRVLLISLRDDNINRIYFHQFMKYKTVEEYIKLGTGSTFAEYKIYILKDFEVTIPPSTLQNQFAEIVKQIDKQKFEIEKSLKETQELYESLMEKYFG